VNVEKDEFDVTLVAALQTAAAHGERSAWPWQGDKAVQAVIAAQN
jgi:hypothetical protein